MQVSVSSQHLSISSSSKEYRKEKLTRLIKRYFDHASSAIFHFNKQNHGFCCDIVVNDRIRRYFAMKNSASSEEVYFPFNVAFNKFKKQLRKYKYKLKDRSNKLKVLEINPNSTKYIILSNKIYDTNHNTKEINFDNPVIFSKKATKILKFLVSQTVIKINCDHSLALMFRNINTYRINVFMIAKTIIFHGSIRFNSHCQ